MKKTVLMAIAFFIGLPGAMADQIESIRVAPSAKYIEFGVGVEATSNEMIQVAPQATVRVEYMGYKDTVVSGGDTGMVLYLAKLKGKIGVSTADGRVEQFNASVSLVNAKYSIADSFAALLGGELVVVQFWRDNNLGEKFGVVARLVDLKAQLSIPHSGMAAFYIGVALKALGYRMKDYYDRDTFHGFDLGGIGLELGEIVNMGRGASMEFAIGAYGDVAFGRSRKASTQADASTYGSIRFVFDKFGELYVIAGLKYAYDSGLRQSERYPYIMSGITFRF